MFRARFSFALAFVLAACLSTLPAAPQEASSPWPRRVLITNDNGIADGKIVALARAFALHAETWVVAPSENRSGSAHYLSVSRLGQLRVEPKDVGPGIQAFAVDGYPADAVLVALCGLMRDHPPDLVVSGINGGPNLADDWLGSGTIGAARFAAYMGVPAIAVSGLNDDIPGAVAAATDWVVRLAQSPVVQGLKAGQYLTLSMPRLAPSAIRGVRVASRARHRVDVTFDSEEPSVIDGSRLWRIRLEPKASPPVPDTDQAHYDAGFIVVVPMRADEHDEGLLNRLRNSEALPPWPR
jgi:5'-nucleotidase